MISFRFKRGVLLALVASTSVLSLGSVQAQDAFDAHVADIVVLQPKSVQADVGITAKQRVLLSKYADAHALKVHAYFDAQQKKGVSPNRITPSDPTIVSYYEALKTNIVGVLKPAQLRRLREITLQLRGYAMLLDPVVGVKMGVTGPERERVKTVVDAYAKFAQETTEATYQRLAAEYRNVKPKDKADELRLENEFKTKIGEETRPKISSAHTLMNSKVTAILSPEQRAKWKSLLGKPFKIS